MIFGPTPVATAAGAILAHSLRVGRQVLKKGRILTSDDVAALATAGFENVIAARQEQDDLGENEAAERLARAVAGAHIARSRSGTGRVNLSATASGLAMLNRARIDAFNTVDEAITIATLPPFARVAPKQMLATIKIIPFAVSQASIARCAAIAASDAPLIQVAPFRPLSVALVQTLLPGTTEKVLTKGLSATQVRVADLGGRFLGEHRVPHDTAALADAFAAMAQAGTDIALVLGGSAITDRRDVVPAAVTAAGGHIEHFGMPVDPGNLTLLARLGDMWVLGMPGSARSPRMHGSDWVLQRLVAGVPTTGRDIMLMGVGGLLTEIPGRPLPRAAATPQMEENLPDRHYRIAALLLAAGQSRRMGPQNKLLAQIEGKPMVRQVAETVLRSTAKPVLAVLGHEAARVRAALHGLDVATVDNPDYADGLSTSLKRGIQALPDEVDGVLVCLGDMPRVAAAAIDRLIAAFDPTAGRAIVVPSHAGKRGNPVLIARRFFAEIQDIAGDVGARPLMSAYPDLVHEIPMPEDSVLFDVDTPQALERLKA